jgi:uncharacterized membrane protein
MRIPPDIKQSIISVGSITAFVILLILNKPYLIYVFIGGSIAVTLGYSIMRTAKTLPLMKKNSKEAQQVRKEYRDKVLLRHTSKDTQQFFGDYEQERLNLSKKMMMLMFIPLGVMMAAYVGIPEILRLAFAIDLTKIQIAEVYFAAALSTVGLNIVLRRRMGLNYTAFGQGNQLIHAPKSYILTEKGVIFDPPQKMPDVEYSMLKFPAKVHRIERERNFIEIESADPSSPQQIKSVRLYSKDISKLSDLLKPYSQQSENGNSEGFVEVNTATMKT